MPVTSVESDTEALTMTLVADFPVGPERVWAAFTDPRQLERFWGPPGWPATFTSFAFEAGGRARYEMRSAGGEVARGSWRFVDIEAPRGFEVVDSFVDEEGEAIPGMPSMRMTFAFEATEAGARLTNVTYFDSLEALAQLIDMGAVEGATLAMNQLDAVLQGLREFAQGKGTRLEILDDQHVRITRSSRDRAHSCGARTSIPTSCGAGCSAPTAGACRSARSTASRAAATASRGSPSPAPRAKRSASTARSCCSTSRGAWCRPST